MKKIIFCTQRYRPNKEGTSKEIKILVENNNGHVHDIHLDGVTQLKFGHKISSYHALFYPLTFFPIYLLLKFSPQRIIHVYTSLCDRPYLPFLPKKKMIITSTNFFCEERIRRKLKYLKKTKKIIIESEIQKKELLAAGISEEKIGLIYPPVNLNEFNYNDINKELNEKHSRKWNKSDKKKSEFVILDASCPGKNKDLEKRGVNLILSADANLKETVINLLWRGGEFKEFEEYIKKKELKKIKIENKIYHSMNEVYAKIHATIIPYLKLDENLKLIPNSAIESLAAGKPLIVSSQTGIAEIVSKSKCGVVFDPNLNNLLEAIDNLKKNYLKYQRNCRKTAEYYFSEEKFIQSYKKIYEEM